MESIKLTGRRVIYSDYEEVTSKNVLEILKDALPVHSKNSGEIKFLYDYYKGNQPIRDKNKTYRQNINNKVVVNRANEIVSFKTGYLIGNPVQYVCRNSDGNENDINILNDFMFTEDKAAKDKELADWFYICGTAYRMVIPNGNKDGSPFDIYTLDPRNTFVVYTSALGNKPLMGVTYVKQKNGNIIYSVYTENHYYKISATGGVVKTLLNPKIEEDKDYIPVGVPIIEYPANQARLGAFEIVITLLDSINTVESNRVDGVEQFVQSLFILFGTDLGEGKTIQDVLNNGGIALPEGTDAKYLTQELNQTQTQTLIDDMYETVLTICGMPNRNGGTSTSDTGTAVLLRDGWSAAEARALDVERLFDVSEKRFLTLALEIMNTKRGTALNLPEIDIRFTRRNYENIQAKAQVLTTLLANDMVHPLIAYEYSGMFTDPLLAYNMGKQHYNELKEQTKDKLKAFAIETTETEKEEINNAV